MATMSAYYTSGATVKAIIRNSALQFADVVAEEMDSYDAADIDDYDIATTEIGSTGEYWFTWPTWLAVGTYNVQFVPQAGGSIAESDLPNRFGVGNWYYDGTNLLPDWAIKLAQSASPVTDSPEKNIKETLEDTNEMQADLADGGRTDLIFAELTTQGDTNETKLDTIDTVVDAIKLKSDGLNFTGDDVKATLDSEAVTIASGGIPVGAFASGAITADAVATDALGQLEIAAGAATEIADAVLSRAVSNVEDSADGHSLCTVILAMLESSTSGGVWTIKKTDGATTFATKTLATDADAAPITGVS